MESDVRFFRRRANEEMAAAQRAVTEAAKARRLVLAQIFLERLKSVEVCASVTELATSASYERPAFDWTKDGAGDFHV